MTDKSLIEQMNEPYEEMELLKSIDRMSCVSQEDVKEMIEQTIKEMKEENGQQSVCKT